MIHTKRISEIVLRLAAIPLAIFFLTLQCIYQGIMTLLKGVLTVFIKLIDLLMIIKRCALKLFGVEKGQEKKFMIMLAFSFGYLAIILKYSVSLERSFWHDNSILVVFSILYLTIAKLAIDISDFQDIEKFNLHVFVNVFTISTILTFILDKVYELKYLSLYVYWLISHYIYRHNEEVVRMEDAIYLKGFIFLLVTLLIVIAIYLLLIGNRMDKINQAAKKQ